MGVSTNGEISYGVLFEEGYEFPWDENDNGIESWWQKVRGYEPPFQLWDESGNYLNGVKPEQSVIDDYYKHEFAWNKQNPVPVTLVNYCSSECPMYILAVPDVGVGANRGYPTAFEPESLKVEDSQKEKLLAFIREYIPECVSPEARWHLSSEWC